MTKSMKYSKFSKRSIQSEMKQDARLQGKVRDRDKTVNRQGKDSDKMGTKQAQYQYRGFRGLTKFGWFYACLKPIYIEQDRLSGTLVYDSLHWFTLVSRDVELDNLVES